MNERMRNVKTRHLELSRSHKIEYLDYTNNWFRQVICRET